MIEASDENQHHLSTALLIMYVKSFVSCNILVNGLVELVLFARTPLLLVTIGLPYVYRKSYKIIALINVL